MIKYKLLLIPKMLVILALLGWIVMLLWNSVSYTHLTLPTKA